VSHGEGWGGGDMSVAWRGGRGGDMRVAWRWRNPGGVKNGVLSTLFRPRLGTTQPYFQWVPSAPAK
jgi:hypothetical protein